MAKVVIGATIQADGTQAIKTVGELRQELKGAKDELKKVTEEFGENSDQAKAAAAKYKQLQGSLDMGNLRKQLRDARQDLNLMVAQFGEFSPQAVAAAGRVAELNDTLGDTQSLVDAMNPDAKFIAFGQSIQGVLGGFSALQGAMALVGGESEAVQETMVKLQAAMALSQGVDAVLESVQAFKNLGTVIKSSTAFQWLQNAATTAAIALQRAFGVAVNTTSGAFIGLRGAIMATGIGALLAVVGLLVSKIMDWVSGTDEAEAAQKRLQRALDGVNAALERNMARVQFNIQKQLLLAKIAGKSQEDLAEIRKKGLQREFVELYDAYNKKALLFNNELKLGKKSNEELAKLKEEVLKAEQDVERKKEEMALHGLQVQADAAEKTRETAKQAKADRDKDAQERKRQNDAAIAEAKRLNKELQNANQVSNAGSERNSELVRLQQEYDAKKAILQKGSVELKNLEEWYRIQKRGINDKFDKEEREKNKAIEAERIANNKQAAANDLAYGESTMNTYMGLVTEMANNEKRTYEQRREDINNAEGALTSDVRLNETQRLNVVRAISDARKEIDRQEYEHKQHMMSLTGGLLSAASDLAGKHTAVGKTLAVAETTISTYAAAQQAYRSQMAIPEPSAPLRAAIAAATAVLSGMARVKGILSVKVPGGGGGGVSSPSINTSAPLAPQVQTTRTQLDQQSINNLGNQAIKTYVVETDVANNRERIERINRAARLG